MKNLIYKELKLVVSPSTYIFALLGCLLLIPSYPYCVAPSYSIIALLTTFSVARANNDHEFTAMLPVRRNHIVLAKHITVMYTELLQLLVAAPFAIISSFVINKSGNIVGMDANFAFFGIILIAYSAFNIVFMPWYFKTGYKTGMPLIAGITAYILTIAFFEIIISIVPILKDNIDSLNPKTIIYRLPILFAGILIYFGSMYISYKVSAKNFEKVSL